MQMKQIRFLSLLIISGLWGGGGIAHAKVATEGCATTGAQLGKLEILCVGVKGKQYKVDLERYKHPDNDKLYWQIVGEVIPATSKQQCGTSDAALNVNLPCAIVNEKLFKVKLVRHSSSLSPYGDYWGLGDYQSIPDLTPTPEQLSCRTKPNFIDYSPQGKNQQSRESINLYKFGYDPAIFDSHSDTTTRLITDPGDLIIPDDSDKLSDAFEDSLNWASNECNRLNKSVLGPIKDQGYCQTCWDFGTTSAIETFITMDMIRQSKSNNYVSLSEQYTLNTSANFDCMSGGIFEHTLSDILTNGIPTTESCTYHPSESSCSDSPPGDAEFVLSKQDNNISAWYYNPLDEETTVTQIKHALQVHGPLVVAIRAANVEQDTARSKMITPHKQVTLLNKKADHQVVLIGYGISAKGMPYWIYRNSWGSTWGKDGYGAIEMSDTPHYTFTEIGAITSVNYNEKLVTSHTISNLLN